MSNIKKAFENKSLQLATFTITEKGYSLKGNDGEYTKAVSADMENGPEKPVSYIGKVVSLLVFETLYPLCVLFCRVGELV